MEIRKETREFCKYLVKWKIALKQLLTDEAAMAQIQEIIDNPEKSQSENNLNTPIILIAYGGWRKLNK